MAEVPSSLLELPFTLFKLQRTGRASLFELRPDKPTRQAEVESRRSER